MQSRQRYFLYLSINDIIFWKDTAGTTIKGLTWRNSLICSGLGLVLFLTTTLEDIVIIYMTVCSDDNKLYQNDIKVL